MPKFLVTWSIDIEADNHREAAEQVREAQTVLDTTATVFEVVQIPPHGLWRDARVIDLSKPNEA